MRLLDRLLSLVYPNRCVACGRLQKEPGFCADCGRKVTLNPTGSCPKCGKTRGMCDCETYDLAFDGFCAPFLYLDTVREGLIHFKFHNRPDSAEYFGQALAETIRLEYSGIRFDLILCVPISEEGLRVRGYNQAERIARVVSKTMDVPLLADGLIKIRETGIQHKLDAQERFANVKGAFAAHPDVRGKCILLIDDIKTTGATLHECARTLKRQGAGSVFCGAVAMGVGKRKN